MPNLAKHILISPRTWLYLGVFFIGASFLLGYHLDQLSADRVLAKKVGKPEEVLIQNFIPDLHENMIHEVRVLGQSVADERIKVNIGSEDFPRWITVRPVYAVEPEFLPLAKSHIREVRGSRPRPMLRSAVDDLRQERAEISSISGMALAFVIEEVGEKSRSQAFSVIAAEGSVQLIELHGTEVTGSALRETVSEALLNKGTLSVPDSLLIGPTTMTAPAPTNESMISALRWWLAVTGASMGLMAMLAPRVLHWKSGSARRPRPVANLDSRGSFPVVRAFQPIVSQDELTIDEQRVVTESNPGTQIRRRVSRLATFAASSFGGVRSPR